MNEDCQLFIEKAQDCLDDAFYLLKDNRLESACNRAYYAFFDAVRALLYAEHIAPKSHSGAHSKFRELFIATRKFPQQVSDDLKELFDLRQGGDYEADVEIILSDAEASVNKAKSFVEMATQYLKENGLIS